MKINFSGLFLDHLKVASLLCYTFLKICRIFTRLFTSCILPRLDWFKIFSFTRILQSMFFLILFKKIWFKSCVSKFFEEKTFLSFEFEASSCNTKSWRLVELGRARRRVVDVGRATNKNPIIVLILVAGYPSHRNCITCIVGLLDPKKSGSSQLRKWASQKLIGLLRGKPNPMGWSLTWKAHSNGLVSYMESPIQWAGLLSGSPNQWVGLYVESPIQWLNLQIYKDN